MRGPSPQHRRGAKKVVPDAYRKVAKVTGVDAEVVKNAVQGIFTLAAKQMKKTGSFQLALMFNLTLDDVRGGRVVGIRPHRYQPHCWMLKISKPSKTVRAHPTAKFLKLVQ